MLIVLLISKWSEDENPHFFGLGWPNQSLEMLYSAPALAPKKTVLPLARVTRVSEVRGRRSGAAALTHPSLF